MRYQPKPCWIGLLLLAIVMLNGCANLFATSEGVEEKPQEDVVLAMKVKADLIETPQLSAAAIEVEASSGRIRLSGFVETASQRQLATQVASEVEGVQEVTNDIEVK